MPTPPRTTREGELLVAKYRLEALLGAGGMGEVYRAHNELIGRSVAIKVLRREFAENDEVVTRFLREARAANLVRHENVVDVLDVGTDASGAPFIVQELLEGKDLGKYLTEHGGVLGLHEALAIMVPVVEALGLAHSKGVVHRDLKPENVFLDARNGRTIPKILDFGISKIDSPTDARVTTTGAAMGTPAYMSPEQIQGMRHVDARTDVWSIGVILYELLSGHMPFVAETRGGLFVQICTADPTPIASVIPDVSPAVVRVIGRCLRRDPAARYADANELCADLKRVQKGEILAGAADRADASGAHHAANVPRAMEVFDTVDALAVETNRPPASAAASASRTTPGPAPRPAKQTTPARRARVDSPAVTVGSPRRDLAAQSAPAVEPAEGVEGAEGERADAPAEHEGLSRPAPRRLLVASVVGAVSILAVIAGVEASRAHHPSSTEPALVAPSVVAPLPARVPPATSAPAPVAPVVTAPAPVALAPVPSAAPAALVSPRGHRRSAHTASPAVAASTATPVPAPAPASTAPTPTPAGHATHAATRYEE